MRANPHISWESDQIVSLEPVVEAIVVADIVEIGADDPDFEQHS